MEFPLRVIHVVNVRWFNATAWYGLSLARLLATAGHKTLVLALRDTATFARAEELSLPVEAVNLNTGNPLSLHAALRKMSRIVQEFSPHIVNCHRGEGLLFWGLLKTAGNRFALVRTRGDQRPPKPNLPNRLLHTRLVDALIATNSRTAEQCRRLLGMSADRVHCISGGVDPARFTPDPLGRAAARQAMGFDEKDLVLGLLGRFDPVKGQREFLKAVRDLLASPSLSPDLRARIRVMLMGFPTATSLRTVEGWIHEYNLSTRTVITGKVADVPSRINAMDLGVIASQGSEAIARAAFEIMACGVPLISTDVGVMPDLLSPAALAPAGDGSALAALLTRTVSDVSLRDLLRKEQRERMRSLSHTCFLNQTLAVYAQALRKR